MNQYKEIAEHFLKESLSSVHGVIADAMVRQKGDVIAHLESLIAKDPDIAVKAMENIAKFSQEYTGRGNPYLGDVFKAADEVAQHSGEDRFEFREQVGRCLSAT